LMLQQLPEQLMIAEPLALIIQRHDEENEFFEPGQISLSGRGSIALLGHRFAQ
jgi:hypothetical protein